MKRSSAAARDGLPRAARWWSRRASTPGARRRTNSSSASPPRSRRSGGRAMGPSPARPSRGFAADMLEHAAGRELFLQDLYGGANPCLSHPDPRLYRIRLAFALHPQPAGAAAARRARRLRAGHDHHRSAQLQGRSPEIRHPLRDGHRLRFRQQARADRRHELCGRDEEIGLHLPELCPARAVA